MIFTSSNQPSASEFANLPPCQARWYRKVILRPVVPTTDHRHTIHLPSVPSSFPPISLKVTDSSLLTLSCSLIIIRDRRKDVKVQQTFHSWHTQRHVGCGIKAPPHRRNRACEMTIGILWCALTLSWLNCSIKIPDNPPEANVVQHVGVLEVRREELVVMKALWKYVTICSKWLINIISSSPWPAELGNRIPRRFYRSLIKQHKEIKKQWLFYWLA